MDPTVELKLITAQRKITIKDYIHHSNPESLTLLR